MAEGNANLGKFFAENKATTMKAAKTAKATEARKSIPKNVKGKAVLTGITYAEKDGKMRRYVFAGSAITPPEYKGYSVRPTFWMDPGDKGQKTHQELIEEFIGALMAVAGDLADTVRETFAEGKTAEIDKLVAKILKKKPEFAYSTWGDKNVNFNFDGVPEDEGGSSEGDGDNDGTDVDDGGEGDGDDYNSDDEGDGDDGDSEGDGDGEDDGETQDDGPGFEIGDTVTYNHPKEGAIKAKVLSINTETEKVKVHENRGQKRKFEVPFAKIEA